MVSSDQQLGVHIGSSTVGKTWNKIVPYIFILPFILSFLMFFAFPSLYSLVLSFFSYKGYGSARFVGISNYQSLLTYSTFWLAVKNTLFYFIIHTIPVMLFAFLLAAILYSKLLSSVQHIYKPLLFLPQIVPIVASALVFRILFSTSYGAVNQIFGLKVPWLEDYNVMKWVVIILIVWRAAGWFMVIYLAGLTTISDQIIDATTIDGATIIQRFAYVIIPMMKPIFLFAFVIDAIGSFKLYTEPNVILIAGQASNPPPDVAPIMNVITTNINGGSFGMASAAGWMLFFMIVIISIFQFSILRERN